MYPKQEMRRDDVRIENELSGKFLETAEKSGTVRQKCGDAGVRGGRGPSLLRTARGQSSLQTIISSGKHTQESVVLHTLRLCLYCTTLIETLGVFRAGDCWSALSHSRQLAQVVDGYPWLPSGFTDTSLKLHIVTATILYTVPKIAEPPVSLFPYSHALTLSLRDTQFARAHTL